MTPEQIAADYIKRAIVRYGKVFVYSGVASALLIPPMTGVSYHDVTSYTTAVVIAFLAGGAAAIEKLISQVYVSQTPTQEVVTDPTPAPVAVETEIPAQDKEETSEVVPPQV